MSLAAAAEPDPDHLRRLAGLVDRVLPALVSEHLAWSSWRGAYRPDLLPFPRTREALQRVVDNVDRVQRALRRQIAIENPSHYLRIDGHEFDEIAFLTELARRSGFAACCSTSTTSSSAHAISVLRRKPTSTRSRRT